jgi:uncharacterized membrane protein YphA (DoxX/SURF4 family)
MKLAHVGYVLDEAEFAAEKGADFPFLLSVFSDSTNILLMVLTFAAFLGLYFFMTNNKHCGRLVQGIRKNEEDYRTLFPWMARLSLGVALIGAGVNNVLLTPAYEVDGILSFVQVLVGFMLLAGSAILPAILVAIVLYVYALTQDIYFLGNLDYLALMIVVLLWGNTRPGVDHLFGIDMPKFFTRYKEYGVLVLRIGIGVSMAYLAIVEKFLNPHAMQLVIERYELTTFIPLSTEMWVFATGTIELLIALALILGFKTRLAAGIAAIVLTLSFFFFGEDVTSHVTLFGVLSILFVTGSDKWSLDYYIDKDTC